MITLTRPVRINMPVKIGVYTFTDQDGTVINLTTDFVAVSVSCELKLYGAAYSTVSGSLVSSGTTGQVQVASNTFTVEGSWTYQFYCVNGAGAKLWGEPVRFDAAENVEDLGAYEVLRA